MIHFKCTCGWKVYTEVALNLVCPQCKSLIVCDGITPEQTVMISSDHVKIFHELWKELHELAKYWDTIKERYDTWTKKIPFNCNCKTEWKIRTEQHPPDFSTPLNFFRWTVDRHNDINKLNHKQELTFDQALELYKDAVNEFPSSSDNLYRP